MGTTRFGAEVRRLRMAAGLSLAELAQRAHYSKGYLSKIENGEKPANPDLAAMLDGALDAGGALVALTRRRPEPAPAAVLPPLPGVPGDPGDPDGPEPAPLPPLGDVAGTVAAFGAIFDHCRAVGHRSPPSVVLPTLVTQTRTLRGIAAGLGGSADSAPVLLLAAQYAEYTGWMFQEAGARDAAVSWTDAAVTLAGRAGDQVLGRYALVRAADLALYDHDGLRTVALARQAQQDPASPARVRALAAQREAQGHALLHGYEDFRRALDRAAELTAEAESADGPVLGTRSLADPVAITAAWSLLDLGRATEAAAILDREVPRIAEGSARARVRFGLRHALAHAVASEVPHACALAESLLDLAIAVDSATIRVELARLSRTLSRWHTHPAVRDLLPRLALALHRPAS
jgi:DNA-binding XRE family transcriptional regulator